MLEHHTPAKERTMPDRYIAFVIEEPSGHTRASVRGRTAGQAAGAAHRRAARYRQHSPGAWLRVTVGEIGSEE